MAKVANFQSHRQNDQTIFFACKIVSSTHRHLNKFKHRTARNRRIRQKSERVLLFLPELAPNRNSKIHHSHEVYSNSHQHISFRILSLRANTIHCTKQQKLFLAFSENTFAFSCMSSQSSKTAKTKRQKPMGEPNQSIRLSTH